MILKKFLCASPLLFRNLAPFSTISDPFYILGVDKTAEFDQIKKQFYKLAREFHPDKNDSPVLFSLI